MSGHILNSNGTHVGVVEGAAIFDLKGQKLYHLKGIKYLSTFRASWSAI